MSSGGLQCCREALDESACDRAVWIEGGVVDGDVDPDRTRTCAGGPQDHFEFLPAQTAREPIVDGRHHGVIEHVAVEMDPEPIQLGLLKDVERQACDTPHPEPSHVDQVDDVDQRVFNALAACLAGFLGVSTAHYRDVLATREAKPWPGAKEPIERGTEEQREDALDPLRRSW